MNTLFPVEPEFPEGFSYFPDFISGAEEANLLEGVSQIDLHAFNFHGFEAKRKVASFGFDYSFDNNALSKGKEIPAEFHRIIKQVAHHISIEASDFKELLVTEYPVGAVINWHRDAFPFDLIAGISLASDCTFRLRPHDKSKQSRSAVISFPLKRRSLYVIQGIARMQWQHSILPVKEVRYSITLRTLKN
jgi:alkylated DNA repair dioxygenase AlkB